jgi:hypothetical protein
VPEIFAFSNTLNLNVFFIIGVDIPKSIGVDNLAWKKKWTIRPFFGETGHYRIQYDFRTTRTHYNTIL